MIIQRPHPSPTGSRLGGSLIRIICRVEFVLAGNGGFGEIGKASILAKLAVFKDVANGPPWAPDLSRDFLLRVEGAMHEID